MTDAPGAGATVVVVGLGPAGTNLLTPAAREALTGASRRFARTARHPAVVELERDGIRFEALDHHYDGSTSLDETYAAIVEEVVAAARSEPVAYAVPGSPAVAERTVELLRESPADVSVVPGLSFADVAWTVLGVDPVAGARVVDGRSLAVEDVEGPLLVAQCDRAAVLSEVKLVLLERLAPEARVTVLQRLALPDEVVTEVSLEALDRSIEPDHLTSVFVEAGPGSAGEFARFVGLIERLRAPGGCPWDAEQTHHSLTRHLVEEAYEVIEAIEALPPGAPDADASPDDYMLLEEELGDLVAQVVFHATLAREAGAFTMAEVLRGIREKLVRRHPHVFGEAEVDDADHVARNWEQIKQGEKAGQSLVDSVPRALPALLVAHKLFRKASAVGLVPMTPDEASEAVAASAAALADAEGEQAQRLVGDLLATVVLLARTRGFDAEGALRGWAERFRVRFRALERLAAERDVELEAAAPDQVAALWLEAAIPAP